jgi:hypothetical protein
MILPPARILVANRSLFATLVLILALIILTFTPVSADTPTLYLQGHDMAPSVIYIGDAHTEDLDEILMLQIVITTTHQEEVNLTYIALHRSGLASDADVESVSLYKDGNANGKLDPVEDSLLSTAEFIVGKAEFDVQLLFDSTTNITLLVVLSISSEAASGGSMGVDIPNENYIDIKGSADVEFQFYLGSKNSTIMLDTDGDLNPDSTDPDDDNDGYTDYAELRSESDSKDQNSIPKDNDHDFVPDSIDSDDDNDGEPDEYDDFPLDDGRQRDYTMVYIYAVITVVLILLMIILVIRGKPKNKQKDIDEEELLMDDGEEDFDIGDEKESLEEGVGGNDILEDEDIIDDE